MRVFVFLGFFAILLSGCGDSPSVGSKPQTVSFDIKDNWSVFFKSCGNTPLTPKQYEAYKIDKNHLIKIEKFSEDEKSLCRIVYVYDRIISSFDIGEVYREYATLKGTTGKKSCLKKEKGKIVEGSPTETIFEFGTEALPLQLRATESFILLEIRHTPECPENILNLELRKPL